MKNQNQLKIEFVKSCDFEWPHGFIPHCLIHFKKGELFRITKSEFEEITEDIRAKEKQPKQWNGEGLPPVDLWCEMLYPDGKGWRKCKYIGVNTVSETKVYAVVFIPDDNPDLSDYHNYKINSGDIKFRPARTKREEHIEKAMNHIKENGFDFDRADADYLYCLYDAGMLLIE